jgi:hypothetical protein
MYYDIYSVILVNINSIIFTRNSYSNTRDVLIVSLLMQIGLHVYFN